MANPPKSEANASRSKIVKMAIILGGKHYVLIMSSSYLRAKITTWLKLPEFEKLLSEVLHLFQTKTRI